MIIVSGRRARMRLKSPSCPALVLTCGATALRSRRLQLPALRQCLSGAGSPTGLPLAYRLDTPSPR